MEGLQKELTTKILQKGKLPKMMMNADGPEQENDVR
jgi:hypothetical protein